MPKRSWLLPATTRVVSDNALSRVVNHKVEIFGCDQHRVINNEVIPNTISFFVVIQRFLLRAIDVDEQKIFSFS